jgi:hypothetical protein
MSTLSLTRDKIYKTVARQLHGVVPCWVSSLPFPGANFPGIWHALLAVSIPYL